MISRSLVSKLEQEGLTDPSAVRKVAVDFYDTCIQYLDQRSGHLTNLECMQWASIKHVPKWSDVEKSMDFTAEKQVLDPNLEAILYDEFTCVANMLVKK